MEWLILLGIIAAISYAASSGSNKSTYRDRLTTERNRNDGRKIIDAPKPKKLNVELADIGSVRLSDEQRKIYDILEKTHENVYITGKAGTGKSLLLEYFVNHTKKTVAVVAPTGIAALNVGGMTIHSFFKFPPDVIDPKNVQGPKRTDLLKLKNVVG